MAPTGQFEAAGGVAYPAGMTDRLSALYQEDLLSGSYVCVDRIVLDAYFRLAYNAGASTCGGGR